MTARRGRAPLVIGAALALLAFGALWVAGRTLRRLDAIDARVEAANERPDDPGSWAPAGSLTCDLRPPGEALRDWAKQLAASQDECVSAPPAELVAWLEAHAAEVDALALRVRAMGPIDLPDTGNNMVSTRDETRHLLEAGRAMRLLVASAGVAAAEGRHDVAEARLDAAWPLAVSFLHLSWNGVMGENFLGTLRTVRTQHPRKWLERLDAVDERSESAEEFVADARQTARNVEQFAERSVPAWLPAQLRPFAVRVAEIPPAWSQVPGALAHLDARDALLAQDRCADPAEMIGPSWLRDVTLPRWLPSARRARIDDLLARTSRRMGSLNLTRAVIAARGSLAETAPCGPRVRVTRAADGRLTAVVDTPPHGPGDDPMWLEGPTRFTFSGPPVRPVMASAPGR